MQHLHGETAHGKKQWTTTHSEPNPDDAIQAVETSLPDEREQVIRRIAYAFYEARGHIDGHELDDWLKAEAQFTLALPDSAQAGTSTTASH